MAETTIDTLLSTLLFEGYALFPYTPSATKNRTPTPFGIVYPPVYAKDSSHTFDESSMQIILRDGPDAEVAATVAFLEPAGERHEGVERRIEIPLAASSKLIDAPVVSEFAFDIVQGNVELSADAIGDGLTRLTLAARNTTNVEEGLDRPAGLKASMMSTHLILTAKNAKFVSPIAPEQDAAKAAAACRSVNIFPVLATDEDDTVLGACIMLPDHPQLAPESEHDLFDSTEIEEALLLHVLALSDGEREAIAAQDPKVRDMIERASNATAADFERVRGRVTITRPEDSKEPLSPVGGPIADLADTLTEVSEPAPLWDDEPLPGLGGPMWRPAPAGSTIEVPGVLDVGGEEEVVVKGVTYKRLAKVILRPEFGRAPQDMLWDGHSATIERIMVDVDDDVHICVTVDDDPGQALMRDMGRYLYFKPSEVEVPSP